MIITGDNNFLFQLISLMLLQYIMLRYLLRLNSIVPCINLFIDLLIFLSVSYFLNEANKCSQASGEMGLTII